MKIVLEREVFGERTWCSSLVYTTEYEGVTIIDNGNDIYINYSYYYQDGTSMPNNEEEEQFTEFVPKENFENELDYWLNLRKWNTIKVSE